MAYGVVRTDKMSGTKDPAKLVSFRYMGSGSTATAIDNGCVVKLDGYMTGERELYKGVTPEATTAIGLVALVASVETLYDERKKNLDEFTNEAGADCRGYLLETGNEFSVTKDALDGLATPAVGNIVELKAGVKLNVVASATASSTVIGKIVATETTSRYTYYTIRIN